MQSSGPQPTQHSFSTVAAPIIYPDGRIALYFAKPGAVSVVLENVRTISSIFFLLGCLYCRLLFFQPLLSLQLSFSLRFFFSFLFSSLLLSSSLLSSPLSHLFSSLLIDSELSSLHGRVRYLRSRWPHLHCSRRGHQSRRPS